MGQQVRDLGNPWFKVRTLNAVGEGGDSEILISPGKTAKDEILFLLFVPSYLMLATFAL